MLVVLWKIFLFSFSKVKENEGDSHGGVVGGVPIGEQKGVIISVMATAAVNVLDKTVHVVEWGHQIVWQDGFLLFGYELLARGGVSNVHGGLGRSEGSEDCRRDISIAYETGFGQHTHRYGVSVVASLAPDPLQVPLS